MGIRQVKLRHFAIFLPRQLMILALLGSVGLGVISGKGKSSNGVVQALELSQSDELVAAPVTEAQYKQCTTTWLDGGLRDLYCRIEQLVDYAALGEAAGVPIFLKGPHSESELNFFGGYEFGYYNPDFLTWVQTSALVTAERERWHQPILRSVYDSHFKLLARVYYRSHQALLSSPEEFEALKVQYQLEQADYQKRLGAGETNLSRFTRVPMELETAKAKYLQNIQTKSLPAEQVGFALGEDFRWLADSLATRHEGEYEGQDAELYWYVALTSGGFWVRRTIDGTEAQFLELLTQVLERYDASWLKENHTVISK